MKSTLDKHMLRWGGLLVFVVSAAGVYAFSSHVQQEGWLEISSGLRTARLLGWAGIALLAALEVYLWLGGEPRLKTGLEKLVQGLGRARWLMLPLVLGLSVVYPLLVMGNFREYFTPGWTRYAFFIWLMLLAAVAVAALLKKGWAESVLVSGLTLGVVYHLFTYFPHVTNYPFTLWWSETTRYYLASTFFAERIYGHDVPWAFRDLTRYLTQAVPFLIPDSQLWVHRLWQVILRFSTGYLTGMIIAHKLKLKPRFLFWVFSAWAGLYFFQGPVFYNLIVIVMLVVWLEDVHSFRKTLAVVVGVSVYAGFSRVNWIPMPGLMMAAYYFLRTPVEGRGFKAVARYLAAPAVWVLVGMGVGLGIQQFWATSSGNPPEIYYSSFTSYLLWQRLFPNPSYPIGILLHILLVTSPLIVYLLLALRHWKANWHLIRVLALAAITGGLFAGGLLVSVKIGGGTNLHNMDEYLVMLLVIVLDLYFSRSITEQGQPVEVKMPAWLKTAALAAPVVFVVSFFGQGFSSMDMQAAQQDLDKIQAYVDEATADGGEVLFITQRHLITFGLIENVELVHEHEKLLLQEMAMSKNEAYLQSFGQELADHKYALILMDHLPSVWKDPEKVSLAMENNVVLKELVPLFTCAYQEEDRLIGGSLDILTPKEDVTCEQVQE